MNKYKIAAQMCLSPNLAAKASGLTGNECRAIRDKKSARRAHKNFRDPLLDAAATRRWRTPSARRAAATEAGACMLALQAELARSKYLDGQIKATRASLILAGRAARALGFTVRRSNARGGAVSSYYCHRGAVALRISDHDIPATPERDYIAQLHGRICHDGYHGRQIIVDEPRRYEWLRRAIILVAAGRM